MTLPENTQGRSVSGWRVKACCPCGKTFDALEGDLFFVREQCCPDCGTEKYEFTIETVRWVWPARGPWWKGWPIIARGYWQKKDQQA